MAVTINTPAPYAPASAIIDLITRYRSKHLATPFTSDVLSRAGVSDSLIPRTMQALATLDLIDSEGMPTETLEGLRRAPETDLKPRMAAWINAVYADVLSFVNPTDDENKIRDAFRPFNPVGQQPRMISLFIGLCRAAGMLADDVAPSAPRPTARKPISPPTVRKVATSTVAAANRLAGNIPASGIPAPLSGLLTKLPPENGTWTQVEKERFKAAFDALLDFCFTVANKPEEARDD